MTKERFLVTGAMGCIGSWVVRNLVKQDVEVVAFDLASVPHRMRLIMDESELAQVVFAQGDITDQDAVEHVVKDNKITHIIHLAALQVPFCKADPPLGARVNVVGTVNVFEAAKSVGLKQLIYASSIAVYGPSQEYPQGPLQHDAQPSPRTHYGVFKLANEGTARIYWLDDGIASVGLRPYIVYGPGRDQGLTSDPSKAMLAAAAGKSFHIGFGGTNVYNFTSDTADAFISAARTEISGAETFNLGGHSIHMSKFVSAIEEVVPEAAGTITYEHLTLPFPEDVDVAELNRKLGKMPVTPLEESVATTIKIFRQVLDTGQLVFE